MSDKDKQEATEKATRAMRQSRHAARNAADAAEAATDHVKSEIADVAGEGYSHLQNIAKRTVYTEIGRGALIIGVGLITLAIGAKKLQNAREIRENVQRSLENLEGPA